MPRAISIVPAVLALVAGCSSEKRCEDGTPQVRIDSSFFCPAGAACVASLEFLIGVDAEQRREVIELNPPKGSGTVSQTFGLIPEPTGSFELHVQVKAFERASARGAIVGFAERTQAGAANECNIVALSLAPFVDATDAGSQDAIGPTDGGDRDAEPLDGSPPDGGPPDADPADVGPPDTGPIDAGPADAGPADAGPPDVGPPDTGPPDAGGNPLCEIADFNTELFVRTTPGGQAYDATQQHTVMFSSPMLPTLTQHPCGDALVYDDTRAALGVPNANAFNLSSGSISAWVRFDPSPTPPDVQGIVGRDANGNAPGHLSIVRNCSDYVVARIQGPNTNHYVCSDAPLTAGWHKLTVGFGAAGFRVEVDGAPQSSTATLTFIDCTEMIACGANPTTRGISGNSNPWIVGWGQVFSQPGSPFPLSHPFFGGIGDIRLQGP